MCCELECEVSGVVQCHSQGCGALCRPSENATVCILLLLGNLEKESLLCVCTHTHTHPQTHTPSHTHMFNTSILAHTNSCLRDSSIAYSSINTLPPAHTHTQSPCNYPTLYFKTDKLSPHTHSMNENVISLIK